MTKRSGRRALSAVEVVVIVAILAAIVLVMLMSIPRGRETARRAGCQRNLMQIGVALVLYSQDVGHLPVVPELGSSAERRGSSPQKALLETLAVPDFLELAIGKTSVRRQADVPLVERPIPGFVCPSDPNATGGGFPAPTSYRATAGSTAEGRDGVFAPGRQMRLTQIDAGDGLSYTAAFSERLVGTGRSTAAASNYVRVPGPISGAGCAVNAGSDWRGDAGSSWVAAEWRSTLYNHARPPDASPSCIAVDERSAHIGASSGHPGGVNVLTFDGAVRTCTPRMDPGIWRSLATPNSEDAPPERKPD
jgi:prepilin-type processing-associated H-X9-DG protein